MTTALLMAMTALLSVHNADPSAFGLVQVDSITSPPDKHGEVSWVTSDMGVSRGWVPTLYDAEVLGELFGPALNVAPDTKGWAFASMAAPDFGVVLVPRRDGRVTPYNWNWGNLDRYVVGSKTAKPAYSAWLNALTRFQASVKPPTVE